MKPNIFKNVIIILSLAVFGISLTQVAVIVDFHNVEAVSSLVYFLMGSTAILGGGALEWFIWLANPLSLFTILYLKKDNKKALVTALVAIVMSGIFRTWNEILGSESGSMARIVSFEAGYYLWLSSIIILGIGTYLYFLKYFKADKNS